MQAGYQAVYDADLKGYFDSIPHSQLLECVRMRVVDRSVLKLIRMWLEAPVVEERKGQGGGGNVSRPKQGTEPAFERVGQLLFLRVPASVYCEIKRYVQGRLIEHLQRRSQRPYRPPQGVSWLGHLASLGLIRLSGLVPA